MAILVIVNNIDHNKVCGAVLYHQVKFHSENVIVIKLGNQILKKLSFQRFCPQNKGHRSFQEFHPFNML